MPTEYFEQRERALLGQRYEQLYAAPQQTAERGVTVSALRTTPEQFAQRADFPLEPSPFCKAAFVVHQPDFKPGRHPYHHAGVFYSQEPSASSAAPLLGVQPGMRVLDLCAAPGGKSSQLAAALQGRGVLVSNEYVAARAEILKSNLERMGVSNAVVLNETLWGLGTSLYKVIMGHMEGSTEILAARALAGNIEDLCTVAIFAIGNTTAIIVGREIGAGRREHVYEVGATLDTLAFLCGLIIGIPLILGAWFVFPWLVYPFFHLSETAGSITTMMLTFIGVFLALRAFDSVNTVGVLRGGGDVRAATIIDTTPLWFVSLPLAALFGLVFQWGIFWVYVGIMAEQFVKFGIGLYRLRSREWINDVTQFSRTE